MAIPDIRRDMMHGARDGPKPWPKARDQIMQSTRIDIWGCAVHRI
jgi:hypothetical protein